MRAVYSKPAEVLQGWRIAFRGLAGNPLLLYWQRHDRAVLARSPWYQRYPGLLLCATALSAALCFVLYLLNAQIASLPAGSYTRISQARELSSLCGLLLLGALLILGICWLLSAFFNSARLALGFLEAQPRAGLRRSLDDTLAVSQLSEQDLLLGLLLHTLRHAWLPTLVLALACGTAIYLADSLPGYAAWLDPTEGSEPRSLGLLLALVFGVFISGLLGWTCCILMLTTLGLGQRTTLLPLSGAVAQTMTQFLLISAMTLASFTAPIGSDDAESSFLDGEASVFMLGLLFCGWLLSMLFLYVGRRWDWLRFVLGHSLLAPLLLAIVPVAAAAILSNDIMEPVIALFMVAAVCSLIFSAFCPAPLSGWLGGAPDAGMEMLLTLVCFQLLSIFVLAGFARDAIQRRKWEGR